MKIFKYLVALVAVFFSLNTSVAQSVSPGFQAVGIYNGFGHCILPESFTFKGDVDLGGQFALLRTVEVDYFGTWNNYQELSWLSSPITTSGIDQFVVPLGTTLSSWVRVHYRYLQDPDGMGPLNAGDDAILPIEIGPIQAKPETEIEITDMDIFGPYLYVDVYTNRYVEPLPGGNPFDAHLVLEVRNQSIGGAVVWYDSSWVNPAGTPFMTKSYTIYLLAPGEICVTARMRYSHDGPGYSDFTGELVGATTGNNCEWYISTTVSDVATEVCYIKNVYGEMTIVGAPSTASAFVYSVEGKEVGSFSASEAYQTTDLTPGVYIIRVQGDAGVLAIKKVYIGE